VKIQDSAGAADDGWCFVGILSVDIVQANHGLLRAVASYRCPYIPNGSVSSISLMPVRAAPRSSKIPRTFVQPLRITWGLPTMKSPAMQPRRRVSVSASQSLSFASQFSARTSTAAFTLSFSAASRDCGRLTVAALTQAVMYTTPATPAELQSASCRASPRNARCRTPPISKRTTAWANAETATTAIQQLPRVFLSCPVTSHNSLTRNSLHAGLSDDSNGHASIMVIFFAFPPHFLRHEFAVVYFEATGYVERLLHIFRCPDL